MKLRNSYFYFETPSVQTNLYLQQRNPCRTCPCMFKDYICILCEKKMTGSCVHAVLPARICLFFWNCMPWAVVNKPMLPIFDHDVCVENGNSLHVGLEGGTVDLFQMTQTQAQCAQACARVLCKNVSFVKDNACECAQTLLMTMSHHLHCQDTSTDGTCAPTTPRHGVFKCASKKKLQTRFCTPELIQDSECVDSISHASRDVLFEILYYDLENNVLMISALSAVILFFSSFATLACYHKRAHFPWSQRVWKLGAQTPASAP